MAEQGNPESTEAIGGRLELTRIALGIELRQAFAVVMGVTPQAYTNMVKGRARPSLDSAMRVVRRYSVTLDWIYRGNEYGMPRDLMDRINQIGPQSSSKGRQRRGKS